MTNAWYRTFFDDWYLRTFLPELTAQQTAVEVDGIVELGGFSPGDTILDVACGHGRHAIEMAARGYEVTGLDLSGALIDRARDDALRADVDVTWLHQDMREPAGDNAFVGALNLFNSFGYLEDEHQDQLALDAISTALTPDGLLVQEFGNRESLLRSFRPADVHHLDDGLVLVEERELDLRSSRLTVRYQFMEAGQPPIPVRTHVLRLYSLTELIRMHADAGLHVEATYGGLEGGEADLDDPYVVLISRSST